MRQYNEQTITKIVACQNTLLAIVMEKFNDMSENEWKVAEEKVQRLANWGMMEPDWDLMKSLTEAIPVCNTLENFMHLLNFDVQLAERSTTIRH